MRERRKKKTNSHERERKRDGESEGGREGGKDAGEGGRESESSCKSLSLFEPRVKCHGTWGIKASVSLAGCSHTDRINDLSIRTFGRHIYLIALLMAIAGRERRGEREGQGKRQRKTKRERHRKTEKQIGKREK